MNKQSQLDKFIFYVGYFAISWSELVSDSVKRHLNISKTLEYAPVLLLRHALKLSTAVRKVKFLVFPPRTHQARLVSI